MIQVALIEDELPAARLLHSMLNRLRPSWSVLCLPGSVEGAVNWFQSNPTPDLLFLDIQLTDGTSFHFLERSRPNCPVVFTTAYDEYAVKAFSVNSIDYLLKPFDEERLEEALTKFENLTLRYRNTDPQRESLLDVLQAFTNREKRYRSRFLIAGFEKFWTLQVSDIAYFYSENRTSFAVTHKGEEHIVEYTLEALVEQLDPDRFFRANRKYVLHIDSIKRIEPYFNGKIVAIVQPPARERVTVSKEKLPLFKQWLNY